MAFVKLARGSSAAYFNISTHSNDTVYFLKDNPRDSSAPGLLYLGDTLIGSNIKDVIWNSSDGNIIVERFDPDFGDTSTTINLIDLIENKIDELASGKIEGVGPIRVSTDSESGNALIDLNIDSTLKLTQGATADDPSILGVNVTSLHIPTYTISPDTQNPLRYVLVEHHENENDREVGSINIPEDQFLQDASIQNGNLVLTWKLDSSTGPTTTSIPITDFFKGIIGEGDDYVDVSVYTDNNSGKEVVSVSVKQTMWDAIDASINNAVSVAINDVSTYFNNKINDLSTGIHDFLGFDSVIGTGEGQFQTVKSYVDTKVIPGGDELERVMSQDNTIIAGAVGAITDRVQNIEVNVKRITREEQGLYVDASNRISFDVSTIVGAGSALTAIDGKIYLNWEDLTEPI